MSGPNPLISVITVCRNEAMNIAKTVESVKSQQECNVEYIVVDGASTDGTLEYLRSQQSSIDHLISEKDSGIYDAMNKGAKLAQGDYLYFLNGGDLFYNDIVLKNLTEHAIKNPSVDIIHGKLAFSTNQNDITYKDDSSFFLEDIFSLLKNNHLQQCFFIRRKIFDDIGYFNAKYKFVADSEFIIRCFNRRFTFSYLPVFFCIFDMNGISIQRPVERLKEKRRMILSAAPLHVTLLYFIKGISNSLLKSKQQK